MSGRGGRGGFGAGGRGGSRGGFRGGRGGYGGPRQEEALSPDQIDLQRIHIIIYL